MLPYTLRTGSAHAPALWLTTPLQQVGEKGSRGAEAQGVLILGAEMGHGSGCQRLLRDRNAIVRERRWGKTKGGSYLLSQIDLCVHYPRPTSRRLLQAGKLVPHMAFAMIDSIASGSSLHVLTPVAWAPDTLLGSQQQLVGRRADSNFRAHKGRIHHFHKDFQQ